MLFFLPQTGVKKVGFTATKKVGNAVKRNRSKRRLRALFYQHSDSLRDGVYIFVAKQVTADIQHTKLHNDFRKTLQRLRLLKEETLA